mmetsp:Transcript_11491/g.25083  ORF Transcript_11491/g.25083 Transcript_11491/m.25083 type:complete len:82 (+) Transcript_11491:210-455(+)
MGMRSRRRRIETVCSKFSNDLDCLLKAMRNTSAHFIRCIKPSQSQSPGPLPTATVEALAIRIGSMSPELAASHPELVAIDH